MAPVRTPGRKRREADYSAIGQHGRKTGITVPDLGPRDEHGLEPVDGLFSSPGKPASPNGHNDFQTSGEDMDIANSSQLEASQTAASMRQSRSLLPRSRSPIKTMLGSSPRRSTGHFGISVRGIRSPAENDVEAPFFSRPKTQKSTYNSLENVISVGHGRQQPDDNLVASNIDRLNGDLQSPKRVFDLMQEGVDEGSQRAESDDTQCSDDLIAIVTDNLDQSIDGLSSTSPGEAEREIRKEGSKTFTMHAPTTARGRGRKRKSDELTHATKSTENLKRRNTRSAKRPRIDFNEKNGTREMIRNPELVEKELKSVFVNNTVPEGSSFKAKKRKSDQRNTIAQINSVAKRGRPAKSTPKGQTSMELLTSHVSSAQVPANIPKPSHSQDPGDARDSVGPIVLRSGRTSVKPLAFWRGERVLYEPPKELGANVLLGGYIGVDPGRPAAEVRERTHDRARIGRRKRGIKRGIKRVHESSEDDDQQDEWETQRETPGILVAEVSAWDPETQKSIEDAHEKIELALAPLALDERTQWDKQQTFKFGKTLTLPFFHSGVVDLPPGGEKRPKNSRKNHMIFWVFSGRVLVEVSGNTFSIGCGGMWQVPRGNSYGLSNPFDKDARIFFAQGCYMEQPEDESALISGATASAENLSNTLNGA